jgi:Asp-tRNA(Asn)/Glu-tRNA(Gln) amidotransferase C subunit
MPSIKVDEKLLKHVADVARLHLTEEEIKAILPQMKEILKLKPFLVLKIFMTHQI